jgi:putative oxidoreductase
MVPVALAGTAAATLAVVGLRNKRLRSEKEGEQGELFGEDSMSYSA